MDAVGNAYIVGSTDSADFPATLNAYQVTPKGGGDIFVAKVNATGTGFSYATLLGSSGADAGYGIDIDSSGNAYVTGEAGAGNYPTTAGVVHTTSAGGRDCVVSKLNPCGKRASVFHLSGRIEYRLLPRRGRGLQRQRVRDGADFLQQFPSDYGLRYWWKSFFGRYLRHKTERHGDRGGVLCRPGQFRPGHPVGHRSR